ncbi:MAG: OmpA family protein [Bacteroidales bacterium]|nr:OmpA family protein [Bacteroidales bacterium]MDD7608002.1 OmpA family protein [Bacteroidales bacterium]MDY5459004.1 OmpA family protein [Candidatus Cryptobacteroides sp.]MEE0340042.1 OmpA family protein [Bacteroidales bacterium]
MKLNKIITVAGLVVLVALGTSCQSKKAKEAAERAAAEAAARAAAEAAAAAAKPAPVFELSDAVKAVAGELVADDAESYRQAVKDAMAQTAYGSATFAMPTAGITYESERCDLNPETKALLQEFLDVYNATDKTAIILIEPYANDTKDKEYNKAIAVERANLVRNWLYAYQVPARNVKVLCPCKAKKTDLSKRRVNVSIAE